MKIQRTNRLTKTRAYYPSAEFKQMKQAGVIKGTSLVDVSVGEGYIQSTDMSYDSYSSDTTSWWNVEAFCNSIFIYDNEESTIDLTSLTGEEVNAFMYNMGPLFRDNYDDGMSKEDIHFTLFGTVANLLAFYSAIIDFVGYVQDMPVVRGTRENIVDIIYSCFYD